jgi:hypothetical protein
MTVLTPDETIQFWLDELEFSLKYQSNYIVGNMKAVNMNIFTACEVFFTFLEAPPCHVH